MSSLLSLFSLLLAVAFFTLLERKVLGYIMLRRGPNKPSILGLFVPFADAIKLLAKPFIFPLSSSPFLIVFSCILSFVIPSLLWLFIPWPSFYYSWSVVFLALLVVSSFSVYALLAAGLGSNSNYSSLGALRCIAQCISYEVCLSVLFLAFCLLSGFLILSPPLPFGLFIVLHLVFILFITVLAETNRSPFDFAEGESELVSGYNVDFSGPGFVILFLAEYLSILFMSFLVAFVAFSCSFFLTLSLGALLSFSFIWARGSLPRFRYDQLMYLSWNSLLPIVLCSILCLLVLYYQIIALNAGILNG